MAIKPTLTRDPDFYDALPVAKRLGYALDQGHSALVFMPRYSGGRTLASRCAIRQLQAGYQAAVLEIPREPTSGLIDYNYLWQSVTSQLSGRLRTRVHSLNDLQRALNLILAKSSVHLFLSVLDSAHGVDARYYELLHVLHSFAVRNRDPQGAKLQVAVFDDFSLWYYERYLDDVARSELWGFKRFMYANARPNDVATYLSDKLQIAPDQAKIIGEHVRAASGGHVGLTAEICEQLVHNYPSISIDWVEQIDGILCNSPTLEGLRRDLQEDSMGLARVAIDFREPGYPIDADNRRVQFLRRLGILYPCSPSTVVLCGGAIQRLIEEAGHSIPRQRSSESWALNLGMRRLEARDQSINDHDIVVVHMSDLHIGADHAFAFETSGTVFNQGEGRLSQLLKSDLSALGLEDRADCLVLSGDVVCMGTFDEFQRAHDVVRELLSVSGLTADGLVLCAGNHDVQWNPQAYAAIANGNRNISREPFDNFVERIKKRASQSAELTTIVSRSGSQRLRLLTLDSNHVEGPEAAGIGYIARETFEAAEVLLASDRPRETDRASTWVVTHHHVLPVSGATLRAAKAKKVSVLGNAPELLGRLRDWGAQVVLHGHEHQPTVLWLQRWMGRSADAVMRPLAVLAAGSCGAKREYLGPVARNHYFVLIKRVDELVIRSRILGDDGMSFVAQSDLSIRLT